MRRFTFSLGLCVVLLMAFAQVSFAQGSYVYGGNSNNTGNAGSYTYNGGVGGAQGNQSQASQSPDLQQMAWQRYAQDQQRQNGGSSYTYDASGYSNQNMGTGTATHENGGYVFTGREEEAQKKEGELQLPWQRFTYVGVDPYFSFISNNLGYTGGGVTADSRIAIVQEGKTTPETVFGLALGANLFVGRQDKLDTASIVGRVGLDFQTGLNIDDKPQGLVLDFQIGLGYDNRFGKSDVSSDSNWFFWAHFMGYFAEWEGLFGVHPKLIWDINNTQRNGGIGSKLALLFEAIHNDSQRLALGVVWDYSYLPKKTQLNGIGVGGEFYFLAGSMTLRLNAEVLYEMEQIGTHKGQNGVSVFISFGALFS